MTLALKVTCSRCKKEIEGIESHEFTGGFYRVDEGYWKKYANFDENILCDDCMQVDVRYVKDYGYIAKPRKNK